MLLPTICWLTIAAVAGQAQNSISLQLKPLDHSQGKVIDLLSYEHTVPDSLSAVAELAKVITQLQSQSYLEASIDSLERRDTLWTAYLHTGKAYEWAYLQNGNVEETFLNQVGFRQRLYQNKPFHYGELRKLLESLLEYAENNGHPFASVQLNNIVITNGGVSAQIFMKKNRLILLDGVNLIGDANISPRYLENYLGLRPGQLYDKAKVVKVRNRIKELPFVRELHDATVTFRGNKATVNLFLEKRKASRFDILFGLLPNNAAQVPGGPEVPRFLFTGNIELDLHNPFGIGEKIAVSFQQIRPQTQELHLHFLYPYVLNLPFGFDAKFELFKKDTTHLNVVYDLGVQYQLEGGNYIKAFWNNTSSSVLSVDESRIRQQGKLPANLDFSQASFGLEYNYRQLDYRYNPRKGWGLLLRGEAGVKRIKKNRNITDISDPAIDFAMAYDSLKLRVFQYRITTGLEGYLPVFQRAAIKAAANVGIILSPQQAIYQNEQYRIGGNRLLRGFDERSVFATRYGVFTLEYRLLIGQNSYLYAFSDLAYVENITTTTRRFDRPMGFGAGLTFETKLGLFGFSLAVGRQQNSPIDFRNVKTHFGWVSLF